MKIDHTPATDRQKMAIRYLTKILCLPNITEQNIGILWLTKKIASRWISEFTEELTNKNKNFLEKIDGNKALSLPTFNQEANWKSFSNLVIYEDQILSSWGKNSFLFYLPNSYSKNGNELAISLPKGGLEIPDPNNKDKTKHTKQICWRYQYLNRKINNRNHKIKVKKFIVTGIDFSRRYRLYEIVKEKNSVKFLKYDEKPSSIVKFYNILKSLTLMNKKSINDELGDYIGREFNRIGIKEALDLQKQKYESFLFDQKKDDHDDDQSDLNQMLIQYLASSKAIIDNSS